MKEVSELGIVFANAPDVDDGGRSKTPRLAGFCSVFLEGSIFRMSHRSSVAVLTKCGIADCRRATRLFSSLPYSLK